MTLSRILPLVVAATASLPAAEIVSVEKIWDAAPHNAFTDLIRYHDRWFATFREGDRHVGGDGWIRVITSEDGMTWESAAKLTESNIDLRDPKLSVTPEGRLMMTIGGSDYEGDKLVRRRPRVTFSRDGRDWSELREVVHDNEWLWRVDWHEGVAYGVAYRGGGGSPDQRDCTLYSSRDGVRYHAIADWDVEGCSETTVRALPNGDLLAFVRREADDPTAWIGRAAPPYDDWTWKPAGERVGGPNFVVLPDGDVWGGGRSYIGDQKTKVGPLTPNDYRPELTLPSGGDTSYPGFVFHEGLLWMTYYSSHEGKTSIYLAKIRVD